MLRRRLSIAALTLAITVLLLAASYFAHRSIVDSLNSRQLQNAASQTLTRTEVAIDLVVTSIGELLANGATACNAQSITRIREAAFSIGSIKDIYFSTPTESCSGFGDIYAIKLGANEKSSYRMALNPGLRFSKVQDPRLAGLGVAWNLPDKQSLLAIMSTESLLFDMLPMALRESASISLLLDDNTVVSRHGPNHGGEGSGASISQFTARSERYPVAVRLLVPEAPLANWNHHINWIVQLIAIVVSAAVALLTACCVIREPGPVEDLDRAMRSGEITPYFQPIVSLSNGQVVGCEMLARWIKPDGTMISPGRFIPIAEMSGRSQALSEVLLLEAGKSLGSFLREQPEFKLTFNVTPEQFLNEDFVGWIDAITAKAGLCPQQLVVELTERQEMSCLNQAQNVCERLSKRGVKLALDDTGTGHNGLSCITSLGATCIKIDKLFVDGVAGETRSRTLVELLVQAAHEFGMTTVAEGIEDETQVQILREIGATQGQGFFFSKALDAEAFVSYCQAHAGDTESLLVDQPMGCSKIAA